MPKQVYEQLTLFQEDSPASLLVWLESKKVKGTTVISGLKCLELSESLRRVGSSVRTYLESCELPLPTLYRTWSAKAITSQCLILKLRLSARRTEEKESSSLDKGKLWSTACAMDAATERMKSTQQKEGSMHSVTLGDAVRLWPTPNASDALNFGSTGEKHLQHDVDKGLLRGVVHMWPTPTTRDYKDGSAESCKNVPVNGLLGRAVHLFPTPNTSDAKGCGPAGSKSAEDKKTNYLRAAVLTKQQEGQLNPDWVEWLMGFPVGWTSLTSQG